jgi:hypothetical protein
MLLDGLTVAGDLGLDDVEEGLCEKAVEMRGSELGVDVGRSDEPVEGKVDLVGKARAEGETEAAGVTAFEVESCARRMSTGWLFRCIDSRSPGPR